MSVKSTGKIGYLLFVSTLVALSFPFAPALAAQGDASLSATSLVMDQTEEGAVLTLTGPVDVTFGGDRLTSDSAIVSLRFGAGSLMDSIISIELEGSVQFQGADGTRASAASATFMGRERRLSLRGGASFSRGTMTSSAGSVDYSMDAGSISLSGNVTLGEQNISAQCDSAAYDLKAKTGDLSGSVTVRYKSGAVLFGSEAVDEVVLNAPALHISVADGEVSTPSGNNRATIVAGEYSFAADSLVFKGSQQDGISSITAEGSVVLDGPKGHLSADRASLSTSDRIFRAEGNVEFSILGQEGSAQAIEVNFASGWTIRLTGGEVGGSVEQLPDNGNNKPSG
jgi:lipopolysaccharide export system protein LptA